MMEDYRAINQARLPARKLLQRTPETGTGPSKQQILSEIQENKTQDGRKKFLGNHKNNMKKKAYQITYTNRNRQMNNT